MTTKELINKIVEKTGMTKTQVEQLMTATTKVITSALQNDHTVQLQNFGTLEPKERRSRQVTNPKTGAKSVTRAKRIVSFRANNKLKTIVK